MIERELLKQKKVSLTYGVVALIYGLAVVSFIGFLRPQWLEQTALEKRISAERSQLEFMDKLVQQRPALEAAVAEQADAVRSYEQLVPAAVELPEILLAVKELASILNVELMRLDYIPLRNQGDDAWYSMGMELRGRLGSVFGVVEALADAFPSLYFGYLSLAAYDHERVVLQTDFDLYVIPPEREISGSWQRPVWENLAPSLGDRFGVPLHYLQEFLARSLKVVGVVRVQGGEHRALIEYNGTQDWKRVGDSLGAATIIEIGEAAITFDVHGVRLSISYGGSN